MKISHILIPTDLSEEALRPCEPVTALAKTLGARVTLIHSLPTLSIAPHGAPLAPPLHVGGNDGVRREVEEALGKQRDALDADLQVDVAILEDEEVAKGIAAYAEKHGVDLIALSTHGRTGLRRLALGSIAEGVLRHAHVPVLCFPRQT